MRSSVVITAGFFLLLAAFRLLDIYHTHFFEHGPTVIIYQAMRSIFIPYLIWLSYALGALSLRRIGTSSGLAGTITCCLAGASLWHIILFAIGLAGFYTYPVMVILAGGVMLASIPLMRFSKPTLHFSTYEKILPGFVALAVLGFLFIKATYPSGGHDFYTLYYPYYLAVIRDGALGPNEVWYQYFYGKGAGLFFLSMILADPLAIHLATASMIAIAALIIFEWVASASQHRSLGLFAVFLYLAYYIYTPAYGVFQFTGGWGDIEKTHEFMAVFILGILWLISKIFNDNSRSYRITLSLAASAVTILSLEAGFVVGFILLLATLYAWFRKAEWKSFFIAGAVTGATLSAIHIINYFATGIPSIQALVPAFRWIDWQRIVQLGTSLELYILWNGMVKTSLNATYDITTFLSVLFASLRLFLWWPFFAVLAIFTILTKRSERQSLSKTALPFVIALVATIIIMLVASAAEPLSFFRFTTYCYAPLLILALLFWAKYPCALQQKAIMATLLILVGVSVYTLSSNSKAGQDWKQMITAAARFNAGIYSVNDATKDISGRSKDFGGKLPLLGTHPAFEEIYKTLPAGTRVWSIHNLAYCMLPACNIQRQSAFITSPTWYQLPSLSIEQGKTKLESEGLNYIFYSRAIPDVRFADAKDVLAALYPGLSPEHIADTFGVAWTNGIDYLITWKELAQQPLDDAFLASWQRYYTESVMMRESYFPTAALAPYIAGAAQNHDLKHPLTIE